ncbi:restriction endonuclease subunit S [Lactiplantibacillus plantarum]|uniref:restriction endonuclease subunit S n=1 Tax=Lactiplantibacillus plantarum TaxID=1590 RepID=UPI003F535FC2
MKDKETKYPQLRFKGFDDPWEQRKLGEVTDIFDGTHQTPKYTDSGVKFVSVENIGTLETKKYISQEAYENEYSKKQAEKGDVLMTRIGDIGTAKVIESNESLAYYVTLALLKTKEIDSNFLARLIASPEVQRDIWKRTLHIAFPKKINLGEINQVKVNVASLEEQQKIGDFFQQLDNLITLHQRKLAKLKELKQGYLQKLFPKNGSKFPQLRFAGFADAWEQRKLGDTVIISSGVTGDTTLQEGKYRVTRIESISQGIFNLAKLGFTNEEPDSKYLLKLGDILYSNINSLSHIGKVALVDSSGIYHGINLLRFQMRDSVNSNFLFQQLNTITMKSWAVSHANPAVSQASINQTELSKQPILLPTLDEQQKIGSFFNQLDNTIALHQRKLEKLQELKKGYLQKMFC